MRVSRCAIGLATIHKKDRVAIALSTWRPLTRRERAAAQAAIERYATFYGFYLPQLL
jgi:hypothetical protein